MSGGNLSEHPSVFDTDFAAEAEKWTRNGIALAKRALVGRKHKHIMVDIEQSGWDRFIYWATALGQLPNKSFVRNPVYKPKDVKKSIDSLTRMANEYAAAFGGVKDYQFGIYNSPGVASADVTECLAGMLSPTEMYERFANSSLWWLPELSAAVTYLCPEVYPSNSWHMRWSQMVAYNLTKYAYDYAHLVGTAAVASFPNDVHRLRPVITSKFAVQGDYDKSKPFSFPFMDLRTAFTAQLCGLRDAGISNILLWNNYGTTSLIGTILGKAAQQVPLTTEERTRWLNMTGLSGQPVTEQDLDAAPPRAQLVSKLEARATDELIVIKSVFGSGDAEVESVCSRFRTL